MRTPFGKSWGGVSVRSLARHDVDDATAALATSVFVGMQPVLTQVPPTFPRSMMATLMPAPASRAAREGPAWPVPMTIASKDWLASAMAYGASGRAIEAWPRT